MFWEILIALLIFIITLYLTWELWIYSFKLGNFPSTLPLLPWLGCTPYIPKTPLLYYQYISNLGGKLELSCDWYGPFPVIRINKIQFLEEVLRSKVLITKSFFYELANDWFGGSVLTLTGSEWKKRRILVNPAFHFNALNSYTKVFEEYAIKLRNNLVEIESTGKAVDIQPIISRCTLGIICETAMGVKIDEENVLYRGYTEAIKKMKIELFMRTTRPWLWNDFIFKQTRCGKNYLKHLKTMEEFTVSVINEKIQRRGANSTVSKSSFLDILLTAHEKCEISVHDLVQEVNTFMFAGHDTSSSALSWLFYHLGLHPDIQDKLYNKIQTHSNGSTSIIEQVSNTDYLEMVIKESLRISPPVPIVSRRVTNDVTIDGNHMIRGSTISILIERIQKNTQFWENPNEFDPERFNKNNCQNRKPYTFIPFSAGPRNCVGQKFAMFEIKIIIFIVLAKFKVVTIKQNIKKNIDVVLKSQNGIWVKFVERV